MEIHHYSEDGVYVGSGVADLDPIALKRGLERHIFPANSTTEKPPVTGEAEQAVFANGVWSVEAVKPVVEQQEFIDERTAEQKAKDQRAAMLAATDWYVIRQAEGGESIPAEVSEFRTALRDITKQSGFPDSVVWPVLL